MIDDHKLEVCSTEKKKGLSMYYQDTLANMFKIDGNRNESKYIESEGSPQVNQQGSSKLGLLGAIKQQIVPEYLKSDAYGPKMAEDPKVHDFKQELKIAAANNLIASFEDRRSMAAQPARKCPSPDFFKREYKNPAHYGKDQYGNENRRFRDIYTQSKENEKSLRKVNRHKDAVGSSVTDSMRLRQEISGRASQSPKSVEKDEDFLAEEKSRDSLQHLAPP